MRDSYPGTNKIVKSAKARLRGSISERKLRANQENAKKSTGPKTQRGKAFSGRNAVKHGLFCRPIRDCEALSEDPREYEEMLDGLWKQYQPIGKAEEIEVERVAVCCWRLKRAWRFENAVNLAARRDFVRKELAEQNEYCKQRDKEEQAIVLELQNAQNEIKETGEISLVLKEKIIALVPEFEALWSSFHHLAQERLNGLDLSRTFQKLPPEEQSRIGRMLAAKIGVKCFEELSHDRWTNVTEAAFGQYAIPNRDALDKLLRYETTIDKALNRALNRLEQSQTRRRGPLGHLQH